MASLTLKNIQLVPLASWLNELTLSGKKSRERTRFVKGLVEKMNKFEEEKKDALDKYVRKEEDGKTWKKVVDNGSEKWDIADEDMKAATDAVNELLVEDVKFDVLESNKENMAVVKDLVLNTDYQFGPKLDGTEQEKIAKVRQAGDYEMWCEAFEALDVA